MGKERERKRALAARTQRWGIACRAHTRLCALARSALEMRDESVRVRAAQQDITQTTSPTPTRGGPVYGIPLNLRVRRAAPVPASSTALAPAPAKPTRAPSRGICSSSYSAQKRGHPAAREMPPRSVR